MIDRCKLSKDVTLVSESYWDKGERIFEIRLRPPKKECYDTEEECIRFEGTKVFISPKVLHKYGIDIYISTDTEDKKWNL